jgi:hypothetical protein
MLERGTSTRLVHALCLLAEPEFGSRALALVDSGATLAVSAAESGFLRVQSESGLLGYVPAAACTPLVTEAAQAALPQTHVVQPVSLYRHPSAGSQFAAPWIVSPDETLQVIGREFQFVRVQRQNGQTGYVPALACGTIVATRGPYPITRLRQPVALYGTPAPGGQISSEWIVAPEETLLVLGGDSSFLLVQRDDGRLGFVPAALCGDSTPEQIFKVGRLDLGWIAIGGGWLWANWIAVAGALRRSNLASPVFTPFIGLALLLGIAALLWFGSRRRYVARSFAIGTLLAYALLHFASNGVETLWS